MSANFFSANVFRKPLMLILLGALALRLGAAAALHHSLRHRWNRDFLIEGDANGYWQLGEQLARGQQYAIYEPPRRVLRMPGFPAFLALSMQLGQLLRVCDQYRHAVARVLLAAVGTAACGLVYLLGRKLFDEATGLIAAGWCACMPTMIGFSVVLLSETLFAACLVASLVCMAAIVRLDREKKPGPRGPALSLGAGLAMAAACYVRPTWVLVGPIFAALYLVAADNKRTAAWRGGLLLFGLAAAMAPWAIRNYSVTGRWVVTTLWVGPSLYDALNPNATGQSNMDFFESDRRQIEGMSEYEIDRYYRSKAWRFALDNPGRALELAAVKLWRFWKPWPNAEQFDGFAQRAAVAAFFVPLVLLAAWGGWLCRGRFWDWTLTIGPIIYFSAIHMVFVGSLRYRLPAEYPLSVLAAVGLRALLKKFRVVSTPADTLPA